MLFKEYSNIFEKEADIIFRRFDIDMERIKSEIMFENALLELSNSIITESDTVNIDLSANGQKSNKTVQTSGKKRSAIGKICDYVIKLISDIIETVSNIFTPSKSHIDVQTYLSSSQGKIELENDLLRVQKEAEEEVRKGRKIIQALSKGTKIDDAVIEKYVDGAAIGAKKYGKTIIPTAAAYVTYQKATGNLEEMKDNLIAAAKFTKDTIVDPDADPKIAPVYYAMKDWVKEATSVYNLFGQKIYKEALKQEKAEQKKNKKIKNK